MEDERHLWKKKTAARNRFGEENEDDVRGALVPAKIPVGFLMHFPLIIPHFQPRVLVMLSSDIWLLCVSNLVKHL